MQTLDLDKTKGFIRLNREGLGIKSEMLADMLGVSTAAISQWENGSKSIDLPYIALLCDLFEISIDDFVKNESSKYYNVIDLYDFGRDYFVNGQLNMKCLKTSNQRIAFVTKYCQSLKKFKSMIEELFEGNKVNDYLLKSFIDLFGAKYNGERLTIECIQSLITDGQISYQNFIDALTLSRDMNEMIFDFFDYEIFVEYIGMIGQNEKNALLLLGIDKNVNNDLIVTLIRHGAVLKNEAGETDFEKTLKLIQNL